VLYTRLNTKRKMRKNATLQREVDTFLATGDHDLLYRNWPGRHFFERAEYATECFRSALLSLVRARSSQTALSLPRVDPPHDIPSFVRAKVEPMVRGLFRRDECGPVLKLLENSVVFILPESIEALIQTENLENAWSLANIYLTGIGAERTGEQAPNAVGMSVETKCFVSHLYFTETNPFFDWVVHEAAHIFHNVKRKTAGLRSTRRREWLLPIDFRHRETFAYACEVYSRILELANRPKDRKPLLEEAKACLRPPGDMVDFDEYVAILSNAVARRNGWKAILEGCSAMKKSRKPSQSGLAPS